LKGDYPGFWFEGEITFQNEFYVKPFTIGIGVGILGDVFDEFYYYG